MPEFCPPNRHQKTPKGSSAQMSVLALIGDSSLSLSLSIKKCVQYGYGSKLKHRATAGFSPWFYLPGFHFGYLISTHMFKQLGNDGGGAERVRPGCGDGELALLRSPQSLRTLCGLSAFVPCLLRSGKPADFSSPHFACWLFQLAQPSTGEPLADFWGVSLKQLVYIFALCASLAQPFEDFRGSASTTRSPSSALLPCFGGGFPY